MDTDESDVFLFRVCLCKVDLHCQVSLRAYASKFCARKENRGNAWKIANKRKRTATLHVLPLFYLHVRA